jgi:predicted enzyme related to lactoylglutathione lyase
MRKNGVAHFEIYADDPEKLGQFYKSLFDWDINAMPMGGGLTYHVVKTVDTDDKGAPTQPGGINGGMLKRPAGYNSKAWVNYVNVDSLDASVEKAVKLGAKVTKPRAAVPNMGWFAMLTDPEGTPFALWQADKSAK